MNRRLALYNRPYPRIRSYFDLIDMAAELGLETVEGFCHMELTDPDTDAAARIRAYADEKGVGFCCFSLYADIVGEDAEAHVRQMKEFAEVAAILGSPYLHHTIAPFVDPARDDPAAVEAAFRRGVEGVREIFDYAAVRGVRAIYEDQGLLFNGTENFDRFIREVDRDIGVVADFGNIYQADERVDAFIRRFSDRIVHVHLKDMRLVPADTPGSYPTLRGDRCAETPVGTGSVDFAGNLRLLQELGYTGYYALEYGAPTDDSPLFDRALWDISGWLA